MAVNKNIKFFKAEVDDVHNLADPFEGKIFRLPGDDAEYLVCVDDDLGVNYQARKDEVRLALAVTEFNKTSAGVRQYNAASISAALAKTVTRNINALYFPEGSYSIDSEVIDLTNIDSVFEPGAILTGDLSNMIFGNISAGDYKIFDINTDKAPICNSVKFAWYGPVADGVADDAPCFRNAMKSLYLSRSAQTLKDGTIKIPAGEYFVDSYDTLEVSKDEFCCFAIPASGVHLDFDPGATVKMSGDIQGTLATGKRINVCGIRTGVVGARVTNLTVDWNGILLDASFRSYNAIHNCGTKTYVENIVSDQAPGLNVIMSRRNQTSLIQPSIHINKCKISNGNQNISGNINATDCSFIYIEGDGNIVENCEIYNTATAESWCGGIELHCINSIVRNCKFTNLWPGIYDGASYYLGPGPVFDPDPYPITYNNLIENNTFVNCFSGVYKIKTSDGSKIINNTFTDCSKSNDLPFIGWSIMGPLNSITGETVSGIQNNMLISGNIFYSTQSNSKNLAQIYLPGMQNTTIENNKFYNTICGIDLPISTTEIQNVDITGNIFINPEVYTYQGSPSPTGQVAIDCDRGSYTGTIQGIYVHDNIFWRSSLATSVYAVSLVAPVGATLSNLSMWDNNFTNIYECYDGVVNPGVYYIQKGKGFRNYPGGLFGEYSFKDGFKISYLQRVYNNPANTNQSFSFVNPFENACLMAFTQSGAANTAIVVTSVSKTAVTIQATNTPIDVSIMAIGY